MQYMGGKQRLVKHIAPIINSVIGSRPFVSPFVGGGSIESAVRAERKILNNANPYLIAMYKRCKADGCDWLPSEFSEQEYKALKANRDSNPALSGFVGFACCFAGKFFQGYARRANNINYCDKGKRGLQKRFAGLSQAEFSSGCYSALDIPQGSLVYCDPPYSGTTGYKGAKSKFCSIEFYEWARQQVQAGCIVLISEIEAPADFVPIWSKPFTRGLKCAAGKGVKSSESLFCHESQRSLFELLDN